MAEAEAYTAAEKAAAENLVSILSVYVDVDLYICIYMYVYV